MLNKYVFSLNVILMLSGQFCCGMLDSNFVNQNRPLTIDIMRVEKIGQGYRAFLANGNTIEALQDDSSRQFLCLYHYTSEKTHEVISTSPLKTFQTLKYLYACEQNSHKPTTYPCSAFLFT